MKYIVQLYTTIHGKQTSEEDCKGSRGVSGRGVTMDEAR